MRAKVGRVTACHSMDASVLMFYSKSGELLGVLGIHVDDILGGCRDESVIEPLRKRFKWGSFAVNSPEYTFCGRLVTVRERTIRITMPSHNEAIEINKLARDRRSKLEALLEKGEPS